MSSTFGARRGRQPSRSATHGGPTGPDDPAEPMADPESVARLIGLNLLEAAPKTRAQLADAMARRGVPAEAASAVLDRFGEVGLVDDAAFAASWVQSRQRVRGLAPRALVNELRERGVAAPLIAEAVAAIDQDDVESAARELVLRKARATTGLPTAVRMRRLIGMLNRKGYASDVAVRVVRAVLAEETHSSGWIGDDAVLHEPGEDEF